MVTSWARRRSSRGGGRGLGDLGRLQAISTQAARLSSWCPATVFNAGDLRAADLPLGSGRPVMAALLGWWDNNAAASRASVLFCYALGRPGPRRIRPAHLPAGVRARRDRCAARCLSRRRYHRFAETVRVRCAPQGRELCRRTDHRAPSAFRLTCCAASVPAPVSPQVGCGCASIAGGVLRSRLRAVRPRRRRLLRTIEQTGAACALATHGYSDSLARYLREIGLATEPLETLFGDGVEEAGIVSRSRS